MLRSDDDRTRGANAALGHITKLDHTVVRIDGVHLRKGSMVIRGIRGGDPGTPYATLGAKPWRAVGGGVAHAGIFGRLWIH